MMKRLLAFLLSIVMVISMMPLQAFAQEAMEETSAETIAEAMEETVAKTIAETMDLPETAPVEETRVPQETAEPTLPPEEAPVEETQAPQEPEILATEAVPEFEAEPQPRSASGDCSAEDGWNETNDVSWSLDDNGTLTISGTGRMRDYSNSSTAPWFSERLNVKTVVVESGVTRVGDYAFYYCVNLQSVTISGSVKIIGNAAFLGCTALPAVQLPSGVKEIYYSAFSGCVALTQVQLPDTLTYIGSYAFSGCKVLPGIRIPGSVKKIESYAFQSCTALKEMVLPQGITYVASDLFSGCTGLERVSIPDSVTSIGSSAFYNCTSLKEWPVHAGVTSIESYAFRNCSALTEVTLPEGIPYISEYCFAGCTGLKEITIPKGVAKINGYAFSGCTGLTTVTFPAGLVSIGGYAFQECDALDNVTIPDGTTSIGSYAFYDCDALANITIADTVSSLGGSAFSRCTSLEQITLPGRITALPNSLFSDCTNLVLVTIPESVTVINNYAFYNCDSLPEMKLHEGVTKIGYQAFYDCDALAVVSIPGSVTQIGEDAFSGCEKLTDITFAHTSGAELSIYADAFYLNTSSSYKDVPTMVSVPYARDIHSAIKDYKWDYYGRTVTFRSYASLPAESLTIDTHPAQVEAGLEVPFTASLEPWYSTSELIWEVQNETGEAVIDDKGILIGIQPGFVTVTCTSSDDAAVCDSTQIEILKATGLVSSIYVSCDGEFEDEIELGQTVQMLASVKPGNAMNKNVTWEVENGTGTATITEDGELTGLTCGTVTVFAIAQDGSEVIGSRVVEIVRYVTNITVLLNGREEFKQLGVEESARLKAIYTPEDASYPEGKITVENGTGEATYSNGYLKGVKAGTVVLRFTANDSRQLTVTHEIEIVGEKATYAVAGGNLYYNTVTGTIIGCDNTATSANIPAIISGTQITSIAPKAFYDRDNLTSVTIPSSVTNIGEEAFYSCGNITSLRFNGTGLKIIGRYAFYNCDSLINLTIPEGVQTIEEDAFYDCDSLTKLTIPGGIASIGVDAFRSLDALKELTISGDYDTRRWLSYNGTLDCATFTGTNVRSTIHYNEQTGKYYQESLPGRYAKKIVITDTVTQIGEAAFQSRDVIEEVVIGSGVTSIGPSAFSNCEGLKQLSLGENVKTIGDHAFSGCYGLTEVTLPAFVQTLGEYAFSYCTSLEKINLPGSLISVGKGCFQTNDDSFRLQLIDLSANPVEMSGQQLKLQYNLPKALISQGNNRMYWGFRYGQEEQEAGDPYPWNIASIDGDSGTLYSQGNSVGAVTVVCRDEYTGARGSWRIEISSGVVIRTDREEDYLISGDVMQLSAWIMPGNIETDVEWSLREQDREYASISGNGKLTARAVTAPQQIQVIARPYDGGEAATLNLWIMPRTTALYIYEGTGDVTGLEMEVDCSAHPSLQFSAVTYPEGALADVYWNSSDEEIAIVDNGLVTFTGLGKVTISVHAADGSGMSAAVRLNVTFQNSAAELTARLDVEDNTLRTGETAQLLVYGADPDVPMDPELLEFGIPGSQQDVATVDAFGLITAGEKPGTATVTASMKGDPLGRRVNLKITVKARETEKLILHPNAAAPAEVQMLDENGDITNNASALVSYSVVLNKGDVEQGDYTFQIIPEAFHSQGSFRPDNIALKWTSSNAKVATVAANGDGTATVTVKKGTDGACMIIAVTTDDSKVENRLTLNIRNSAPRLENQKPVLNTYLTEAAVIPLVASYGNGIADVALLENGAVSSRLEAVYADGLVTICAKQTIPNSSLNLVLQVTCIDGITYEYILSAKVKNTAPSVTVKQLDKFNLFYSDTLVPIQITAQDTLVTRVVLEDTADFTVTEYDADSAVAFLRFSESYILDHSKTADLKANILVYLEGYEEPVKKSFNISATTKKPEVQLTAKSSVVNTAISQEHTTSMGFQLKGSQQLLDLSRAEVTVTASFAHGWLEGDLLILELNEAKGGTAAIKLQLDNWMSPIALDHKVTVDTKIPTLKFSTGTLKLSRIFTDVESAATAILSHSNLELSTIDFESTAKAGTSARAEADKLRIVYDPADDQVIASIADPELAPKAGTYTFQAVATLPDGSQLKAAKLKVSVDAAAPKVTLKTSTLKLNKVLCGYEIASTEAALTKGEGYRLVDFQLPENWEEMNLPLDIVYADGQLQVQLLDAEAAAKTHTIKLYPVLCHEASGQEQALPTPISLRVQIYSNSKITVALSSKGKLDTVDPNSQICYTVKKITNASGTVTGVSLDGPDAELFDACLNSDGTISLKLLPGLVYSVKQTYKVSMNLSICGQDVATSMLSFKVTQSALKLKAKAASVTMFQSQTAPVVFELSVTEPMAAVMETIALNSSSNKTFLDAMGDGEMNVTISEDGRTAVVEFEVEKPTHLQFGKSYNLFLDVTAAGSAADGKTNQIKLTVNVKK